MTDTPFEGIFPPIPTPFEKQGPISAQGLARNLEFLGRFPLAGYVALGSNGESVHLSEKETLTFLEAVREHIPTDRLMIAGTGRMSTQATVTLTRQAADIGADAALVLPPAYYRGLMTKDALVRHFRAVADATSIPVIVYNMPACTGIDLDAETVLEIGEHDNVCGIKDSGGNIAKLAEIRHAADPSFSILAGSASFLLPALAVGATGGVLALANIAPRQCVELYDATRRGDWVAAREIQLRMVAPNNAVTRRWGVPGLKAALDILGQHGGEARLPLLPLPAERRNELAAILAAAGIDLSAD